MKPCFRRHEVYTDFSRVRRGAGLVKLEPKVFRLLCLLAENSDRILSKVQRIAEVWPRAAFRMRRVRRRQGIARWTRGSGRCG